MTTIDVNRTTLDVSSTALVAAMPDPVLSVFTVGYARAGDCRGVVEELARQTVRDRLEILVVAPDPSGLDQSVLNAFAAGQLLILPRIETCGEAMAAAVRAARAPLVAYAEEHATLHPEWAARLLDAHAAGWDVVGYPMVNANPRTLTSWAHLYGQFGPVVAPAASGPADFLAGHHVSYRRDLLLAYENRLSDALEDESALFLDLRERGIPMYLAGDALSAHVNISSLPAFVRMDYFGMRSFAATRVRLGRWPRWKRLAYAGGTVLVPWIRLCRVRRDLERTGRAGMLWPRLLAPLGLAMAAGACGEALGYLLGHGAAPRRKAPVELHRAGFLAPGDLPTHSATSPQAGCSLYSAST